MELPVAAEPLEAADDDTWVNTECLGQFNNSHQRWFDAQEATRERGKDGTGPDRRRLASTKHALTDGSLLERPLPPGRVFGGAKPATFTFLENAVATSDRRSSGRRRLRRAV